jgi:hypothetical protein
MTDEFTLISIEFADFVAPVAHFRFGDDGDRRTYTMTLALDGTLNVEQAVAAAAKDAASYLRAWAQDAEDFAARASAGALGMQPPNP